MKQGLVLEDVRTRVGSFEIRASLRVDEGVRAGLVGPSGSGKTSLLRAIAGLHPSSGRMLLDGQDLSGLPPSKRGIGFVFQEQALFPALTVVENAAFGLKVRGHGCLLYTSDAADE